MSEVGRPIGDDERRSRSLEHLLHYGIKMMVRRDIGGRTNIENHHEVLARQLMGKTAATAGRMIAEKMEQQVEGVRDRQKRSVGEIGRRGEALSGCLVEADQLAKKDLRRAYLILRAAAREMVHGIADDEGDEDTPDTFVLA